MHVSQARTEAIKHVVRRVHRQVHCVSVRHVETEACVGQLVKALLHLTGDASVSFRSSMLSRTSLVARARHQARSERVSG